MSKIETYRTFAIYFAPRGIGRDGEFYGFRGRDNNPEHIHSDGKVRGSALNHVTGEFTGYFKTIREVKYAIDIYHINENTDMFTPTFKKGDRLRVIVRGLISLSFNEAVTADCDSFLRHGTEYVKVKGSNYYVSRFELQERASDKKPALYYNGGNREAFIAAVKTKGVTLAGTGNEEVFINAKYVCVFPQGFSTGGAKMLLMQDHSTINFENEYNLQVFDTIDGFLVALEKYTKPKIEHPEISIPNRGTLVFTDDGSEVSVKDHLGLSASFDDVEWLYNAISENEQVELPLVFNAPDEIVRRNVMRMLVEAGLKIHSNNISFETWLSSWGKGDHVVGITQDGWASTYSSVCTHKRTTVDGLVAAARIVAKNGTGRAICGNHVSFFDNYVKVGCQRINHETIRAVYAHMKTLRKDS